MTPETMTIAVDRPRADATRAALGGPDGMAQVMNTVALGRPAGRVRLTVPVVAAILFAVTIAARWLVLGDPLIQIDEQFYLLVGDRMSHGAVPYIDIWDRKPVGLFLLFAAIRLLGGGGVWEYQAVAILFVCATATILFVMARRVAGPVGGIIAGLLYVLALNCAGGVGGQAPIWYNLPVTGAIAILLFARDWPGTQRGDFRWPGAAIMALFGVALQIKYSAVFEGVFAGLALIGLSWRRGRAPADLAVDALLWVGLALLPTILAAGAYAVLGHGREWVFANVTSILLRGPQLPVMLHNRLLTMMRLMVPLVLAVPLRRWLGARPETAEAREDLHLLDAWAASALLGVVLFGTWYNHYALPLLGPFAVTAAPLVRRRAGQAYLLALLLAAGFWGQIAVRRHIKTDGDAALLERMTAAARPESGCLFIYDGPPALYRTTNSCLLSPHIFPSHLQALNEIGATGIDEVEQVRSLMAMRPRRVVSMEPAYLDEYRPARAALYGALRTGYERVGSYGDGFRKYVVYRLRVPR